MANKVCCEEVKVSASIEMNDRDYLNDILASEKDLSMNLFKKKFLTYLKQ